jgi:osmoprotectant transport system ATP-binding protein
MRVSDIINRKPKNIIQGSDHCGKALDYLHTKESRYGIVLEENKPLGFVTQKSLKYEEGLVRDMVEPFPIFLSEKNPLRDVLSFMLMYNTPTFCIVDGDKNFAGTVTYNDIQKAVKASYADETENVENGVSS